MFRTILAAAFSVLLASAASAATLITSHNPTPAELLVLGGTSLDLPGGASWLDAPAYGFTVPDQVAGSTENVARSPYEYLGAGQYEDITYWNVPGTAGHQESALMFNHLMGSLSFLWGSPDSYNYVTLINRAALGDWQYLIVALSDLGSPDTPPVGGGASYVTIKGFSFDKVVFSSNTPAFEIGNITVAAVPLPAGGLLLLMGLGGLALLRRRATGV